MIRKKNVANEEYVFDIASDVLTYRTCGRRYRFYDVIGFPQSDTSKLWASEFICSFERELYRKWQSEDLDEDDPEGDADDISEDVVSHLESMGMETDDRIYSEEWDSDILMNRRALEVMRFMTSYVYPLISEYSVSCGKHCSNGSPCNITTTFGIMSADRLKAADRDNPVIKAFSLVCNPDDIGDVIFIIKGMDMPDLSEYNSPEMQLKAAMELYSEQECMGSGNTLSAGIVFYLNELWLSKSRLKDIAQKYSEDIFKLLTEGNQLGEEDRFRRCISVIPYNSDLTFNSLKIIEETAGKLAEDRSFGAKLDKDHWKPGVFEPARCESCDFNGSCESVPEEYRRHPGE